LRAGVTHAVLPAVAERGRARVFRPELTVR
jgi:hypothetical protein